MAVDVIMPKLGLTMEEGTLVRWLKSPGDSIRAGEALFEVETDKVTLEVEATTTGILYEIVAGEGATVPVGAVVARLRSTDGEAKADDLPALAENRSQAHRITLEGDHPGCHVPQAQSVAAAPLSPSKAEQDDKVPVSWRARRVAKRHDIDADSLFPGRGPGGRVVEKDILEAVTSRSVTENGRGLKLTAVGRLGKKQKPESYTSMQFSSLSVEIIADALLDLKRRLGGYVRDRSGVRLAFDDILIKIAASALQAYPGMNAVWFDEQVHLNSEIKIGLTIATDKGMATMVLRAPAQMTLSQIAAERARLATEASQGLLAVEDTLDAALHIANLGMFGVDRYQPTVIPPQSCILAVGAIKERPVGFDGELMLKPTVHLTLTYDQRVIDSFTAAAFLRHVTMLIEQPCTMLL